MKVGRFSSAAGHGWPEPKRVPRRQWSRRCTSVPRAAPLAAAARRGGWSADTNCRTVPLREGLQRIRLHVRRCHNPAGPRYPRPYRPEEEGRMALPQPRRAGVWAGRDRAGGGAAVSTAAQCPGPPRRIAEGGAPVGSFSLPPRGSAAHLRGGSARPKGTPETGARHPADRAPQRSPPGQRSRPRSGL
jgi:hypothetical protein